MVNATCSDVCAGLSCDEFSPATCRAAATVGCGCEGCVCESTPTNATPAGACVDTDVSIFREGWGCHQLVGMDCWSTSWRSQGSVEERIAACPASCNACYGDWSGPGSEEQYFLEMNEYDSSDCSGSSLLRKSYARLGLCLSSHEEEASVNSWSFSVRNDGLVDYYRATHCQGEPAYAGGQSFTSRSTGVSSRRSLAGSGGTCRGTKRGFRRTCGRPAR